MLRSSARDNSQRDKSPRDNSLRDNIACWQETKVLQTLESSLSGVFLYIMFGVLHKLFCETECRSALMIRKVKAIREMAAVMKKKKHKCITVLVATLVIGSLLHNLYVWIPNGFTALIAPVNESLWEHTKIIFYPLLLAGFLCNREKNPVSGAAWGLAAVGASGFMLVAAYVYHRVFEQDSLVFDISLFVVSILLGFFLAQVLKHLTVEKGWRVVSRIAVWGMFLFGLLRTVLFLRG